MEINLANYITGFAMIVAGTTRVLSALKLENWYF